ncbi:MAG: N-acetyltransferase [Bacilli bacterium]|jgi:hypothetical protein|nr:N-acetyltransferase [Bacilli bacterium]
MAKRKSSSVLVTSTTKAAKPNIFSLTMGGKVVGRIEAILNFASNGKWRQKRVRFNRFDAIDDPKVATSLFGALEKWALAKGMDEIVGPLGFSDMEREGLLIEGFDQLSTYEEQYNYAYYQSLIEGQGYRKEADWTERKVFAPESIDPRYHDISRLVMKKLNLHFAAIKSARQLFRDYGDAFFDIVDETYRDIYMTVPFTERQRKSMIASFKMILDPKYLSLILDENGECVAFGLCFPSLSKAVQKSGGRLTPACLVRLLHDIKRPKVLDMGLIGVRPDYRNTGIEWGFLSMVMDILGSGGIEYAETNLNLDGNLEIKNTWDRFKTVFHKRRRSYVKKIR